MIKTKVLKNRGKNHEKSVATAFNGERHKGVTGQGKEDVQHEVFSIECKERKVTVVHKFMEQAKRNAPTGKIPLVIVKQYNTLQHENVVCMRQQDFIELFKIVIE